LLLPLSSIFRLLQTLEWLNNDQNLEEIDALLGCGLVMFQWNDLEALIQEMETHERQDACDLLFYAINWQRRRALTWDLPFYRFRELLNAFSKVSGEDNDVKVLQRLKDILIYEAKLEKMMKSMHQYAPLEFHGTAADSGKFGKFDDRYDEPQSSFFSHFSIQTKSSQADFKPPTKKVNTNGISFESVAALRPFMRPFNVKFSLNCFMQILTTEYAEINYILKDLSEKLDVKIVPAPSTPFGRKKSATDDKARPLPKSSSWSRQNVPDMMRQVIHHLPTILEQLETVYESTMLQDSDSIAQCTAHIFDILHKLLSWPDIESPEHEDISNAIFMTLASRVAVDASQTLSFEANAQEAFKYLARYGDNMQQASTAVTLFKTLLRIMEITHTSFKPHAHAVVSRILTTDWFDWRNIKKDIPFLLEQAIELHQDPLTELHNYVEVVLPTYDQDGPIDEHPLLRQDTVLFYYQAMINQTVKALNLLQATDQDVEVVLIQNQKIVKIFELIIKYIKTKEQRALFGLLLKTSRTFVDQFTKHSIPYFTNVFRTYKGEIVNILKNFQTSTRMLQIICSHVKVHKDVQLASYVPPLKKALEIVIFQVKMLLTENNAPSDAFFLGALKHRDLSGAEVSSQVNFF
ncbi:Fanconi anaemia protein FANCD2, partial [Dichotomocladium elegans]